MKDDVPGESVGLAAAGVIGADCAIAEKGRRIDLAEGEIVAETGGDGPGDVGIDAESADVASQLEVPVLEK